MTKNTRPKAVSKKWVQVSMQWPTGQLDELKDAAAADDRPVSTWLRRLVQAHLDAQ